eukprot:3675470-Amphidinium_carterae.1
MAASMGPRSADAPSPQPTWRHPKSSADTVIAAQIDFVLGPSSLMCSQCGPLEWSVFDTLSTCDHRPVLAHFVHRDSSTATRQFRQVSADTTALLNSYIAAMAQQMHLSLAQQIQHLQLTALGVLAATKPSTKVPKKPWIPLQA